ncbi:hypothetical protein FDI24_gp183 [Acidovorax phage ACP17]|uniref:Uncharacterized protein n=1 Tax=Acidovorax phage ACP17 TaxID=2010329 RepID=A0A218M350_9CAUD|nr:hypothetical protein FDI24_gp183 [Acidovorax phage ACP17]ASD50465.1 hypothetical protein [Acidovorax phage ACP17]
MSRIPEHSYLELAAHVLGISEESPRYEDEQFIWGRIEDHHGFTPREFMEAVDMLLPFTPKWKGALTDTVFQGFVAPDGYTLVKQKVQ